MQRRAQPAVALQSNAIPGKERRKEATGSAPTGDGFAARRQRYYLSPLGLQLHARLGVRLGLFKVLQRRVGSLSGGRGTQTDPLLDWDQPLQARAAVYGQGSAARRTERLL